MSKYDALWKYIRDAKSHSLTLTFQEIQDICGSSINHGFLKYKIDLLKFGFEVVKISLKEQTVSFRRSD